MPSRFLSLTRQQPLVVHHLSKVRDNILALGVNSLVLVIGDYNCPTIHWQQNDANCLTPT